MITNLPFVKYVRVCERLDRNGKTLNVLVVDTDIHIPERLHCIKDRKIYKLIDEMKQYQELTKYSINPADRIDETEIRGTNH
tara:strand:- start:910 stop:1155 length:246 start_codon:yes stop_codon:yes gene_type:complete